MNEFFDILFGTVIFVLIIFCFVSLIVGISCSIAIGTIEGNCLTIQTYKEQVVNLKEDMVNLPSIDCNLMNADSPYREMISTLANAEENLAEEKSRSGRAYETLATIRRSPFYFILNLFDEIEACKY